MIFTKLIIIISIFYSSTAIYVPLTGRYFLHSNTGLWRVCRYTIQPEPINQEAVPRNFTELSIPLANLTEIKRMKVEIAKEEYIDEFFSELSDFEELKAVDEAFKSALFANWILNTADFPKFKARYKGLLEADSLSEQVNILEEKAEVALTAPTLHESQTLGAKTVVLPNATVSTATLSASDTTNTTINDTVSGAFSEVSYNGSFIKVIVPEQLRNALFAYWEDKPKVLSVLLAFANDMDISCTMTNALGKKLVIRPPPPPKDGRSHVHYRYIPHGMYTHIQHYEHNVYSYYLNILF